MTLRVALTTFDAARYATTRWHYSKSMPVPPHVIVGAWEDEQFIGTVIFSRGASPNIHRPWGVEPAQACELTRVALREHVAPVSQVVAAALVLLHESNPGLRIVVSYADPNHGHHGGIYQAGNWLYFGTTNKVFSYRDSTGRIWHSRQVSATGTRKQFGTVRKVPRHDELEAVQQLGKHRYAYPLDRAMRRRLASLALPYPRRRGVDGDTPEALSGDTGSTPVDGSRA